MRVRELLNMEVDIDVYDDVCDDIGIAFCGPMKLTEEGKKHFRSVLNYHVTLRNYCGDVVAIVIVGDRDYCKDDNWEPRLEKAKELFESLAGYCPAEDYDRWFEEA